jgi:hypothetical protein
MRNFVYFSLEPRNADTVKRFAEAAAFDNGNLPTPGCSRKTAG